MKLTPLISVLVLSGWLTGCGGGGAGKSDRPETAPATVTVTYKSSPVADATVTFSPKNSKQGTAAFGKTNSSGVVKLSAFPDVNGVVPGDYKVLVTKMEVSGSQDVSMDDPSYDGGPTEAVVTAPKSLIPEKYNAPATTTLEATVKAGEDNSFKFDLVD